MSQEQTQRQGPSQWPVVAGGLLVGIAVLNVLIGDANLRTAVFGLLGLGLLVAGLIRNAVAR